VDQSGWLVGGARPRTCDDRQIAPRITGKEPETFMAAANVVARGGRECSNPRTKSEGREGGRCLTRRCCGISVNAPCSSSRPARRRALVNRKLVLTKANFPRGADPSSYTAQESRQKWGADSSGEANQDAACIPRRVLDRGPAAEDCRACSPIRVTVRLGRRHGRSKSDGDRPATGKKGRAEIHPLMGGGSGGSQRGEAEYVAGVAAFLI